MSIWEVVTRMLLAAVLAGVIGLEREIREHTAGFRTHILVAVGAAAFTLASSYNPGKLPFDPNRISAQVVTGIGFLGAGAIVRYGVSVRGLTTAASLWAVAAVGLLSAQGFYSAALVTTGVVILGLFALRLIEDKLLYPRVGRAMNVRVHFHEAGYASLAELMGVLKRAHVEVKEVGVMPGEDQTDTVHLRLDLPRGVDASTLIALITDLHEVRTVRIE